MIRITFHLREVLVIIMVAGMVVLGMVVLSSLIVERITKSTQSSPIILVSFHVAKIDAKIAGVFLLSATVR